MDFEEYQAEAMKTQYIYQQASVRMSGDHPPATQMFNRMYTGGAVNDEAGELFGKIKKEFRDGFKSNEEYMIHRDNVIKELGDVLWYVTACADEYGYTLQEVAQINIAKLTSRRERGTVQGSGDNR